VPSSAKEQMLCASLLKSLTYSCTLTRIGPSSNEVCPYVNQPGTT
jgi:hypothetical protein